MPGRARISCPLQRRHSEALAGYRAARLLWRELGLPWDEALLGLDVVVLFGLQHPEARQAGEVAREIFVRLGATPFIERLDRAMEVGAQGLVQGGSRESQGAAVP